MRHTQKSSRDTKRLHGFSTMCVVGIWLVFLNFVHWTAEILNVVFVSPFQNSLSGIKPLLFVVYLALELARVLLLRGYFEICMRWKSSRHSKYSQRSCVIITTSSFNSPSSWSTEANPWWVTDHLIHKGRSFYLYPWATIFVHRRPLFWIKLRPRRNDINREITSNCFRSWRSH